ncbi:uncharacterized protein PAC_16056 [Phialocephala subalpina]|uniref:Uncharacterized protein n=1 Tax=Phialocephala subalpina TaxID=576137 RepID=A0A1L7XM82_9HELO|nr:uncharacterized protein PAC_16056 [Phialocephala subalpina]
MASSNSNGLEVIPDGNSINVAVRHPRNFDPECFFFVANLASRATYKRSLSQALSHRQLPQIIETTSRTFSIHPLLRASIRDASEDMEGDASRSEIRPAIADFLILRSIYCTLTTNTSSPKILRSMSLTILKTLQHIAVDVDLVDEIIDITEGEGTQYEEGLSQFRDLAILETRLVTFVIIREPFRDLNLIASYHIVSAPSSRWTKYAELEILDSKRPKGRLFEKLVDFESLHKLQSPSLSSDANDTAEQANYTMQHQFYCITTSQELEDNLVIDSNWHMPLLEFNGLIVPDSTESPYTTLTSETLDGTGDIMNW